MKFLPQWLIGIQDSPLDSHMLLEEQEPLLIERVYSDTSEKMNSHPRMQAPVPSEREFEEEGQSESSTSITTTWNLAQEQLLKAIAERSNCMRWLHTQSQLYFESVNFYLTIPNVLITTLNGSVTMSLTALFPDPANQKVATTIIGLVSLFCAALTTMNQYIKSQQMMEAHRAASLAYGKLHRLILNELALRRDQRQNALECIKAVRAEQDRLETTAPSILPMIIRRFNIQFANRDIEKPEIAGDLDQVSINQLVRHSHTQRSNRVAPQSDFHVIHTTVDGTTADHEGKN